MTTANRQAICNIQDSIFRFYGKQRQCKRKLCPLHCLFLLQKTTRFDFLFFAYKTLKRTHYIGNIAVSRKKQFALI